jgi:asparagine synthase (glutamine-hydrolysing)
LLPPGSLWTFHANGTVERRHYFRPDEWENQERLSVSTYLSRLREVFGRVARRYHTADHPTGLSLTGGLDSRAVIAWTRADPGTMPCYTFGGPYRDCADVRIARELAQLCKQPHTTIRISDEFFAHFDVLAERAVDVSDGTMDVTGAVELYVNALASGIAPVRLTGNYGSEIIRSNVALRPSRLDRRCYTPEFCALMDEAVATYEAERRCRTLTFIAFKQVPWHHYARFAVERSEILPRSPFLDNELVALAYQAPEELGTGPLPMLDLIAGGNSVLAGVSTDRAFRAGRAAIVTKMANSWQEFTVKAEYAYDYGMPQWLARADRTVSRLHLERLFLGRHKFYHFRVWYRDQLGRYVRERLAQAPDERFGYRAGVMQSIVADHLAGRANHTLALHKALTASLVEDLFLHRA